MNPSNRRDAIKSIASAAAGVALVGSDSLSQVPTVQIGGYPFELTLTTVTSQTVRITLQPIESGQPSPVLNDGALLRTDWAVPALRWRPIAGTRHVKCGNLTINVSAKPFAIRVMRKDARLVQELKLDTATGKLTFLLGDAPVLALGQGGVQFDRRGSIDSMGNGQGAYRLATHGARVPVQFAIGTAGWAMYIHQPLGTFDLTANEELCVAPLIT